MTRVVQAVLLSLTFFLTLGCGASVEEKPPAKTAPEMSPDARREMEKQMKMGPGAPGQNKKKSTK